MTVINNILDVRGLNCPLPIVKTRVTLNKMARSEALQVISTDPGFVSDISAFCQQTGNGLVSSIEEDGKFIVLIKKA